MAISNPNQVTATSQRARHESGPGDRVVVVIATPLEADLVARLKKIDDRLDIRHQPDLLPPPRYPGDHRGDGSFERTDEQRARWRAMLDDAQVLFGLPGDTAAGLADVVATNAGLRWVQATSAGVGEQLRVAGLREADLSRVAVTSASGVHAGPLAEFAMFGLLAFTRGLPRLIADKQARQWGHYPVGELAGRTLLVVGLGEIGREVARLGVAFGMRIVGINTTGRGTFEGVEEVRPMRFLADLLPVSHAVVFALPLTPQTEGLIDAAAFDRMHSGTIVVNVGRGGVLDEEELIRALQDGRLAGAALDVFATEPLPADNPLWRLPNVLVSPHTAALSVRENERIVALFTENLRRYLRGEELRNRVDLDPRA